MRRLPQSFNVVIDNLPQVAAAYSDGVAARVQLEIWKRLAGVFKQEDWEVSEIPLGVKISARARDAIAYLGAEHVEAALVSAARRPVTIKTQQIVPSLSAHFGPPDNLAPFVELDAAQHRMDMCAAALAYEALNAGEMNSDGVAARVQLEIWKRLAGVFKQEDWEVSEIPLGVKISARARDAIAYLGAEHVEAALVSAARRPVTIKTQQIVPSLSAHFGPPDNLAPFVELDAAQYRMDMCAAALAYEALNAGEMNFAEQAVVGGERYDRPLYYECLARLFDPDGTVVLPGTYIDALERLGLTRVFDWHVVRETIRQLECRRDVALGCNVSALSVVDDVWWTSAFAELRRRPDIAKRLVIEITETATLPNVTDARAFISAVQGTGARVALDDFGVGHRSSDFACEANVDIVKIDGSYVRNRLSYNGQHRLADLVSRVGEFAPIVVVEGIEIADDLQAATAAGARFFQGYHFQAPTLPDRLVDRSPTMAQEKVR